MVGAYGSVFSGLVVSVGCDGCRLSCRVCWMIVFCLRGWWGFALGARLFWCFWWFGFVCLWVVGYCLYLLVCLFISWFFTCWVTVLYVCLWC